MSYTDPQIGTLTISGDPARFVATERIPVSGLTMDFEPVQDLHGYDYPWPAGGGSNIWDEQWEQGTINATTGNDQSSPTKMRSIGYTAVLPDTDYRYICPSNGVLFFYDDEKGYISSRQTGTNTRVFTTPSNCYFLRFTPVTDYGNVYHNDISIVLESSGVTTYSPYSNICPITGRDSVTVYVSPEPAVVDGTEEYEIEFGQTVYSWTLTINEDGSGQIVADMASAKVKDVAWTKPFQTSNYFRTTNLPKINGVGGVISDTYKPSFETSAGNMDNYSIKGIANSGFIYIMDERFDSAGDFKDTMGEAQIVYELAEPVTIQLDPIEITTLIGLNYVWTSDHNLITISFPYNKEVQPMAMNYEHCWTYPKAYIDRLEARIAALETAAAAADDSDAKTAAAPEERNETVAEELTVTEEPETEPVTKKGGK